MFDGKSILITGEIQEHLVNLQKILLNKYKPKKIIIYSRDEQKHYEMSQIFKNSCMRYFIGDVRDVNRLKTAMNDVDFVIHAAAMKHVPIANTTDGMHKNKYNGCSNVMNAS